MRSSQEFGTTSTSIQAKQIADFPLHTDEDWDDDEDDMEGDGSESDGEAEEGDPPRKKGGGASKKVSKLLGESGCLWLSSRLLC